MAKAKKKKYSASDKAILGIGYVLLGAFVLSILVPLLYVVIASFMDPNVLNSQGISFDVRKWTIDAYRRVLENNMIWRGFANSLPEPIISLSPRNSERHLPLTVPRKSSIFSRL